MKASYRPRCFGPRLLTSSVPIAAHMLREVDSIFRGAIPEFGGIIPDPSNTEIAINNRAAESFNIENRYL
jgi:hypothetical protein